MLFEIDQDYAGGAFVTDTSFGLRDGSNNGFTGTNSRIFFGGTNGTVFDDLVISSSVTAVPLPAAGWLMLNGLIAIFWKKMRRFK